MTSTGSRSAPSGGSRSAAGEIRFDDPADAVYSWRRVTSQPMTRLYYDTARAYHRAMQRCYEACASPMAREYVLIEVGGFGYARGPSGEDPKDAEARLDAHMAHAESYIARGTSYYEVELKPEVVGIVTRLRKHPKPTAPLATLVSHLDECIEAHAHVMGDLHWRMAAGLLRQRWDWPSAFAEITGEDPAIAQTLLSGTANELSNVVSKLRRLARIALGDADLLGAVRSGDVGALEKSDTPPFKAFTRTFRTLLRNWGQRTGQGYGSSVGTFAPTWNVRPEIPLSMIASYTHADLEALERRDRSLARERRRTLSRVKRALRDDPDRLAAFETALARALLGARLMEDHNHWMDQSSSGIMHEAGYLVGERLVADGLIDEAADVVHLSVDELRGIAAGSGPDDLRSLVSGRKRDIAAQAEAGSPEHIGVGESSPGIDIADHGEGLVGGVLRGVAASPGRYTGVARVRMPSPVPPELEDGDVLVAVDAGPDWTPLFALLGAVVLDRGSHWQHAAVMAREFGIPAVTGSKDGTSTIRDGQTVTVDGSAGTVELA